jgi:pyruvate/2-oxoglutarate dehydrogenase complex dihydrolipoamide dehydrogenase (E3) component
MTTTTSYDAIVIGAGQAGPFLAVRLAKAGMRTALVEREGIAFKSLKSGGNAKKVG